MAMNNSYYLYIGSAVVIIMIILLISQAYKRNARLQITSDKKYQVLVNARNGLVKIDNQSAADELQNIRSQLIEALDDYKSQKIKVLLRDPKKFAQIKKDLTSSNETIQINTVTALQNNHNPKAIALSEQALNTSNSEQVQKLAAEGLATLPNDQIRAFIQKRITQGDCINAYSKLNL